MRTILPSLLAVVLTLAPASAMAGGDAVAKAQALFSEGRAAMDSGNYRIACEKFQQSLALVQRASSLLNLAECEQHEGKLVSAAKHWKQGIVLLPAGDDRLAASEQRAAAVYARLAHLTVKLAGTLPAGTRVVVDEVDVAIDDLAAGVPMDPGRHTVLLVVPGSADQHATVDLAEGQSRTVTLAVVPKQAQAPSIEPRSDGGGGLRKAGFALLGVGGAGVIAAGITGGLLLSKHSTITSECPTHLGCSQEVKNLIAGTGPLNVANGISWGVGLAGVAAGVVMVVVGSKGEAPAVIAPTALPGGGGLELTRRF